MLEFELQYFCLQIEEVYKKVHNAIREDPEHKPSGKEPFKGKRYASWFDSVPRLNDALKW